MVFHDVSAGQLPWTRPPARHSALPPPMSRAYGSTPCQRAVPALITVPSLRLRWWYSQVRTPPTVRTAWLLGDRHVCCTGAADLNDPPVTTPTPTPTASSS